MIKNSLNKDDKFATEILANSEKSELVSAIKEINKSIKQGIKSKNSSEGMQSVSLITEL